MRPARSGPLLVASPSAFGRAAERASADAVDVGAGTVVGGIRLLGVLVFLPALPDGATRAAPAPARAGLTDPERRAARLIQPVAARARLPSLALLGLGLGGCNAGLVGVTLATMGAGAVISHDCPGYLTVRLRDELTGAELCGEPVLARGRGRERRLFTCATMALPHGTWELRAERGGATSSVEIERPTRCERWVYDVELYLPTP